VNAASVRSPSPLRTWLPWVLLLVVVVGALAVGSRSDDGPPTLEGRVQSIASEVRCPTCRGQSAAESDAAAARAVRAEIRRRVEAGESRSAIVSYFVTRYGKDIVLRPESTGVAGLVWALPVAALVVAVAALFFAFRRWRPGPEVAPDA
jgi:cytochrome c-type biogenesis protein CcmH